MFTTVQDLGRWGFQSRGVSVSGAMDRYAHRLANRMVGNADNAATLEVTMMGPHVESEEDTAFVVTGAAFELTLNGTAVGMNHPIAAPAGSILKFGERRCGARAYIAVAGGLDVPEVLGSRSTHVLTKMGGIEGRALRGGDRIPILKKELRGKGQGAGASGGGLTPRPSPLTPLVVPRGGARVRVIPGEPETFAHLAARRFRVSPQSNRMGYRLEGADLEAGPAGDLISHAVPTGAVQVPPTGQPIMLMADHATTGGYSVGATVITADLPLAAQLAPGDWIEFEPCSLEEADRALLVQEAALGGA